MKIKSKKTRNIVYACFLAASATLIYYLVLVLIRLTSAS